MAGLRMPNGGAVTLLDTYMEGDLAPGEKDIPLVSIVVPAGAPNGTYLIEAAILDPIFGETLARHSLSVRKQ